MSITENYLLKKGEKSREKFPNHQMNKKNFTLIRFFNNLSKDELIAENSHFINSNQNQNNLL